MGYLLRPRCLFEQSPNKRVFRLDVVMTPRGLQASRCIITRHAEPVTIHPGFTAMTPSGMEIPSSISLPRKALRRFWS